ncbi:precorrin-2 C(20)-methyltransferase [Candidatus Galacturonibacter soehngenii]|uniref:Precorrin-2 C(20)-methyltransferase n=1 Tax=Candidatus Galacturonatibacter soehngenii TaxID=2307010 RepID=A0A7V7QMH7_9FIRM|nr:precorrin-2 C(20)-methyltransferase [Candidatus Galacturonibacter soehngenii]KAB1439900.1 precorrin-2 C(20)-methyltransferase [Candidatus Galacturonibacter soehngenii]MBA4685861.1 precorrin-2 C(20)-methyltransferase [Candidatus Galacturonibacter soehngenii]
MAGILYGVGVGPGDPELLTLKAVNVIKNSDIILVPGDVVENSVAYKIATGALDLQDKKLVAISMPMTKDKTVLEKAHDEAAKCIMEYLNDNMQVAFLTLGDPCIYSTYIYVHKRILAKGYTAKIISGIPSFCAAAALVNDSLVEKSEPLHILPASYDIEEALKLSGTKVLMKSGKKMANVKKELKEHDYNVVMIENCGMEQEKVYYGAENIDENAGYYSLIIAKDR